MKEVSLEEFDQYKLTWALIMPGNTHLTDVYVDIDSNLHRKDMVVSNTGDVLGSLIADLDLVTGSPVKVLYFVEIEE